MPFIILVLLGALRQYSLNATAASESPLATLVMNHPCVDPLDELKTGIQA